LDFFVYFISEVVFLFSCCSIIIFCLPSFFLLQLFCLFIIAAAQSNQLRNQVFQDNKK